MNATEFQKSSRIFEKFYKQFKIFLKKIHCHYISNQDKFADGKIYIP